MKNKVKNDLELLAGGGDTELLDTNYGQGWIPPSGGLSNPTGGFDIDGNGGGSGGQPAEAGGGSGSEGASIGGAPPRQIYRHSTPGGRSFTTVANLSAAQVDVASQIVDYASNNNIPYGYMSIAMAKAFQESSFNTILTNPTHFGVFQYSTTTWSETHSDKDINNVSHQIAAMFSDIERYAGRYRQRREAGEIPADLTFDYYVEYKHHYGTNYDRWEPELLNEFNSAYTTLGLNVN